MSWKGARGPMCPTNPGEKGMIECVIHQINAATGHGDEDGNEYLSIDKYCVNQIKQLLVNYDNVLRAEEHIEIQRNGRTVRYLPEK